MAEFYLKDVEHVDPYRKIVIEKDVLHFKLPATDYDDRADAQNVINFPGEYAAFVSKHPGYRLPENWTKLSKHEDNEKILELKKSEGQVKEVKESEPKKSKKVA